MAIFGKKTEKKVSVKKAKTAVAVVGSVAGTVSTDMILRPHITEKAGLQNEGNNIYTFQVTKTASKHAIAKAITALYKVVPVKVNIVNLPAKRVFVRGHRGTQSAIKKAYVFLKKGDKIEIA
ncbi:MAG: ribosomal subunit protein large subunit ribosomal protein [Candidatus Parcubacteria bacterium]|jgi:large subunit ribosomal protein L23